MGNQIENAMKNAGIESGKQLGEQVNNALDQLEKAIDGFDTPENNSDNSADGAKDVRENSAQEEPSATVDDLQAMLDEQNKTINRLTDIMGKMVVRMGAQISDVDQHNNDPLGDSDSSEMPQLNTLTLGSMYTPDESTGKK